jgi:hypothetical protein
MNTAPRKRSRNPHSENRRFTRVRRIAIAALARSDPRPLDARDRGVPPWWLLPLPESGAPVHSSSTLRRIAGETQERCLEAIEKGETAHAEFSCWWDRLAGLYPGMSGPQTWKRLREVCEEVLQKTAARRNEPDELDQRCWEE